MSCEYYNSLYDKITQENEVLEQLYNNRNSAEPQKTKYIKITEQAINIVNYYLFLIYMLFCFFLAVFIYYSDYTFIAKFVIIILIVTYPWYIFSLQEFVFKISSFFVSVLTSSVYDNGYFEEISKVIPYSSGTTTTPEPTDSTTPTPT